jgi:hypothetical protein
LTFAVDPGKSSLFLQIFSKAILACIISITSEIHFFLLINPDCAAAYCEDANFRTEKQIGMGFWWPTFANLRASKFLNRLGRGSGELLSPPTQTQYSIVSSGQNHGSLFVWFFGCSIRRSFRRGFLCRDLLLLRNLKKLIMELLYIFSGSVLHEFTGFFQRIVRCCICVVNLRDRLFDCIVLCVCDCLGDHIFFVARKLEFAFPIHGGKREEGPVPWDRVF